MLTADELRQLQKTDPAGTDPDTLVDICSVKKINTSLPKEERIDDFIRQIKNPYLFKCGGSGDPICISRYGRYFK